MKKILYICPKNQYDWEAVIPRQDSSPTEEIDIAVLLLQHGKHLQNIPFSQVSALETGEGKTNSSCPYESISYQEFLEKIFLVDLPLVV